MMSSSNILMTVGYVILQKFRARTVSTRLEYCVGYGLCGQIDRFDTQSLKRSITRADRREAVMSIQEYKYRPFAV
jgi:hypothetical protein